jgi:hypothetical protein
MTRFICLPETDCIAKGPTERFVMSRELRTSQYTMKFQACRSFCRSEAFCSTICYRLQEATLSSI